MYGKRGLTIHIHVLATLAGLLTIGLAPAVASAAQISTAPQRAGIIAGVVRDETGLPLPGATVTITAVDGHVLTITRTGSDGSFVARNLPRETVTVDVQLAGFRTTQATVLASPQPDSLAIVLPVPGFTEAVTVTATGREQALASVPSSVGIVSERLLEDAQGLNLAETLAYIPGVTAGDVSGVDDLRISIRGAGVLIMD